jgi:hypothetical protein
MGALIATRGTRRLVTHYTHIFNKAQINGTRNTIINDATPNVGLYDLFTTSSKSARMIWAITQRDPALFLPSGAGHPHLLQRWDYYLQSEFDQVNQERLRALLAQALNLADKRVNRPNGKNEDGVTYTALRFECIEADPHANPPQAQTVLQSDEYDLKNNDNDDSGLDKTAAYSKIVLVTGPTASPTPIDAQ